MEQESKFKFMAKEQKIAKRWSTEIAIVTVIGIILILGISVYYGMMMQDLIGQMNALSSSKITEELSNQDEKLCKFADNLSVSLQPVLNCGQTDVCSSPGKVTILAFYSPSCEYSAAQWGILQSLDQVYTDKVEVKYVCKTIVDSDELACQTNRAGDFSFGYAEGLEIADQFSLAPMGTPILVFNCAYMRHGVYSVNGQVDKAQEERDLRRIIDGLLAE
ncbi:MAG: hypothetical protein V1911_03925 [Candidatus Micrarchaeota archaeon]